MTDLFPCEEQLNQQEVNSIRGDFSSVEDLQPGMELRLSQRFTHASLRSGFNLSGNVTITLTPSVLTRLLFTINDRSFPILTA